MPKISVIIPVYNVEPYLRQCLESVLAQTLRETEILCIDDASTDDTWKILNEFAERDNRIRLFRQEHSGAGNARNLGLDNAEGEFLSFLDGDDFFEPDMLESAWKRMTETGADVVVFRADGYDVKSGKFLPYPGALKVENLAGKECFAPTELPDVIFNSFQNWTWNKLFRRELIDREGIRFQPLWRTNDLLFTCSALVTAKKIAILDRCLAHYRMGSGTNCQATNDFAPRDFHSALVALKEFLTQRNLFPIYERGFAVMAMRGCIYNLFSMNKLDSFLELYVFLQEKGFAELGVLCYNKEYFDSAGDFSVIHRILNTPAPELLFETRRHWVAESERLTLLVKKLREEISELKTKDHDLERLKEENRHLRKLFESRTGRMVAYLTGWGKTEKK